LAVALLKKMKLSELDAKRPRYICKLLSQAQSSDKLPSAAPSSDWFIITDDSLLWLREPVEDVGFVLEFEEIINGWNIDTNYSLIEAASLMRQLDRLPPNVALICNNLIAFNSETKGKKIVWTRGKIDANKLLITGDESLDAAKISWMRKRAMDKIMSSLSRDWAMSKLNSLAAKERKRVEQQSNLKKMDDDIIVQDVIDAQILSCERLLFEAALDSLLMNKAIEHLEYLASLPI
jgi:hypothetical protein